MSRPGRPENPVERTSTGELYRGSLIRERRREKGLSREEMASLLGCHADSFSNVEANRVNPSKHMLAKIAEVLGDPVEYFTQAEVHPRIMRKKATVGAFGSGVGLGAVIPHSRTGQAHIEAASQQLDQNIGLLLVKQIVDEAQLTPEQRILAERLILENARTVCEVLTKEQDQERR